MKCNNCGGEITHNTLHKTFEPDQTIYKCISCDQSLEPGVKVYHKTNNKIQLLILSIDSFGEIKCSWIDKLGQPHREKMLLSELELER